MNMIFTIIAFGCIAPEHRVIPDARPREVLLKRLENAKSDSERITVLNGLVALQNKESLPVIRKFISDSNSQVRFSAILGCIILEEYNDDIKNGMKGFFQSGGMEFSTWFALHANSKPNNRFVNDRFSSDLIEMFDDHNTCIQSESLLMYMMLQYNDNKAVPALKRILTAPTYINNINNQLLSLRILGQLGENAKDAKHEVQSLLKCSDYQISTQAAATLFSLDHGSIIAKDAIANALSGKDVRKQNCVANAIYRCPTIIANMQKEILDAITSNTVDVNARLQLLRALRVNHIKNINLTNVLEGQLQSDSIQTRLQTAITWCELFPNNKSSIVEIVVMAFILRPASSAELFEYLATVDDLPHQVVAAAKEHYSKADLTTAPFIAAIVLKADLQDRDAEEFLRSRFTFGIYSTGDKQWKTITEKKMARLMAIDAVAKSGVTGTRFRDDLVMLLNSNDRQIVEAAAKAISIIDALQMRNK